MRYLKNILLFCSIIVLQCCGTKQPPRTVIDFNTNWVFNYLPQNHIDKNCIEPGYDDSSWPVIGIPHTWSTYETTGDLHPFIKSPSERDDPYWWEGWGYYRKHFKVEPELKGKSIHVEFDGVQKYSRVYLNGQYIGDHKGGFNSFYFDITKHLKIGQENVLVVLVSNQRNDKYRIPPMTAGNWNVYGGIYRDVRLVVKNKVHIPYQGSYKHEGGTFITTPAVSEEKGTVNIKTYIKNDTGKDVNITLKSMLISPKNEIAEVLEKEVQIKPGVIEMVEQESSSIENPMLWSPGDPNIYKLKSLVYFNEELVDEITSTFGFRWFRWDYEKNDLYINGKKLPIRGFNRHQEYPWIGDAIPKWLADQDFKDMKENLGINFIRTAHYPNDPHVYNLTDSLGLAVVEEVPNIKSIDFDEEVQEQNVKEMIRRDRNHPSILFWSVGNETSDAADSKWVVEEDTTRIVHARKAENAGDFATHTHENLDMENLLRVTVRGYFDEENAPDYFDFKPENGQVCSHEEWQHECAMTKGASVRGSMKENVVFWLYEDHGADREYKYSPLKHLNYKGWVDSYRFPKYIYYLTKAMYGSSSSVFIHPHNWVQKNVGQPKDFIVNSNCEKVELYVNEKKIAEAFPSYEGYCTVTFRNVTVQPGILKAIGFIDGREIEDRVVLSGEPAKLSLTTEQKYITAGKRDIAIVTANILDKNGNPVIHAMNTLFWSVKGDATLVGPEIYKSDYNLNESMEGTGYIRVPVSNVLRSGNTKGGAIVTVSSPGLESASVKIKILETPNESRYVRQPVLDETGRAKVTRKNNLKIEFTYEEIIKPISGNIQFENGSRAKLRDQFVDFLLKSNPEFEVSLVQSEIFIDYFTEYLERMKGELIGDDFNYKAVAYNDLCLISKAIYGSGLNFKLALALIKDYSFRIIENGEMINIENKLDFYKMIPSKKMALRLSLEKMDEQPWISSWIDQENIQPCNALNIRDIVNLAYPSFSSLSEEERSAYYKYISEYNPNLEFKNGDLIIKENAVFCIVDPEQFLIIMNSRNKTD